MDAEHIVIGSGLAALGAVLGLAGRGPVIVLAGDSVSRISYYDQRSTVPCAQLGVGGLGNDWHGVIPVSLSAPNFGVQEDSFCSLFESFYPNSDIRSFVGQSWLFVPWKPIRPWARLQELAAANPRTLRLLPVLANKVEIDSHSVSVSSGHETFRARHVWVAAGALHTPKLLSSSFGSRIIRKAISDHVTFYVGQVTGIAGPKVIHKRNGIFFQAWRPNNEGALYTLRPARFKFRELDFGIEQRAVFGMPTGGAVAKIMKRMSPGLLSEALFNRFGIFKTAGTYSVYAQVPSRDAYSWSDGASPIEAIPSGIQLAAESARKLQPFKGLTPSKRMDIYIPGIHLHNSIDKTAWSDLGLDSPDSPLRVIDPSLIDDIGPEHHSFKVMASAFQSAGGIGR